MNSSVVSRWTSGGGSRYTTPTTTDEILNITLSGREYGRGERGRIFGTRECTSGYPYGADGAGSASWIAGRPFPFVMWAISWGPGYLGGKEFYGDDLDMIRPGCRLGVVKVSTKDASEWPGVSESEAHEIILVINRALLSWWRTLWIGVMLRLDCRDGSISMAEYNDEDAETGQRDSTLTRQLFRTRIRLV